jgi:hypothetical protein
LLGSPDAPPSDVLLRRLSKGFAKGAEEVARAELHDTSEVGDSDSRIESVLDISCEVLGLPGGESALQIRVLRIYIPLRAQIDSQQSRRALDAAPCRVSIGVQRDGRGD